MEAAAALATARGGHPAAAPWLPAAGDAVRVRRAVGAIGIVVRPPVRAGGGLTVRVKGAVMTLASTADVEPVDAATAKKQAAATKAASAARARAAATPRAAAPWAPAVMLAGNTVDVRGLDARSAVETSLDAVADADDGAAVFILHGIGTGIVRKAVRQALAATKEAAVVEDVEEGGGGVTLVRVRR